MKVMTVFLAAFLLFSNGKAQIYGDWYEASYQAYFSLAENGQFSYQGQDGAMQGLYGIQGNVLTLQDMMGNQYQYQFVLVNQNRLQIIDYLNNVYNYQRRQTTVNTSQNRPWLSQQFNQVLAKNHHHQWRESDTQVYVTLLSYLIGGPLSSSEQSEIRAQNLKDFGATPDLLRSDVNEVENSLNQIYSLNNVETVAMIREQLMAQFHLSMFNNPQYKQDPFFKILNRHVQVLAFDEATQLNLTNQDIHGYLNYLKFQAQIGGVNQVLSQQERSLLQLQLVQMFNQGTHEQRQTLAFSSFLWDTIVRQWNAMSVSQQQQFIAQNQWQTSATPSNQLSGQSFDYAAQYDQTFDINSLEQQYRNEARAKGMALNQYLDYKQRDMAANNQIYNMMSNMSLENHAMMLNTINNIGGSDDYYYVDYGNGY